MQMRKGSVEMRVFIHDFEEYQGGMSSSISECSFVNLDGSWRPAVLARKVAYNDATRESHVPSV